LQKWASSQIQQKRAKGISRNGCFIVEEEEKKHIPRECEVDWSEKKRTDPPQAIPVEQN
jgi:hypothetical protein